jgi:hypothetical protein
VVKTFIEIAAPFVCCAPLLLLFAFDLWAARIESSEVDE